MFAVACAKARDFTHPVVISRCEYDGKCASSIGAFLVLNPDGWAVTAWHIVELMKKLSDAKGSRGAIDDARGRIERHPGLSKKEKRRKVRELERAASTTVQDFSFWWGWDGVRLDQIAGLPQADLAVGRLVPFDRQWVPTYPTLKDPATGVKQGTSLCRLGYPFHDITPIYENGAFQLPAGSVPPPPFPIEGILTRQIKVGQHNAGFTIGFLETSSPGLMGQSGGPVFDVDATVWSIQSRTIHLALGFNPPVPNDKRGQVEHQFLNVGWGAHPETLVGLLRERGVAVALSAT